MNRFEVADWCNSQEHAAWADSRLPADQLQPGGIYTGMFYLRAPLDGHRAVKFPAEVKTIEPHCKGGFYAVKFALILPETQPEVVAGAVIDDGILRETISMPALTFRGIHTQSGYFKGSDEQFAQPWEDLLGLK